MFGVRKRTSVGFRCLCQEERRGLGQAEPQAKEDTVVQQEPLCRLRPSDSPSHRRHVRPLDRPHPWNSAICEQRFFIKNIKI